MTTNTLNKLSNMILEFELDELFLSAEMEQHNQVDTLKLGREDYVQRRKYRLDLRLYMLLLTMDFKLYKSRELLMPWINGGQIGDSPLTVCGSCAQTMERYVVSRRQGDVVVVAERCVHCLTQFHLKPEPDQVGFGSIPPTGSIKWEQERHDKKKKKRTRGKSRVLESPGSRSRESGRLRNRKPGRESVRSDHRGKNKIPDNGRPRRHLPGDLQEERDLD